jgi:hypothetical protein
MIFSLRHKESLDKRTLKFRVPVPLRRRLLYVVSQHDTERGYDDPELSGVVLSRFAGEVGRKEPLVVYKDTKPITVHNYRDFLEACPPSAIFDYLELFYLMAGETSSFEREINRAFREHRFDWQMASGRVFQAESLYFHEEVMVDVHRLLHEAQFQGVTDEFQRARDALTEGGDRCRDGLIYASHALESTMKAVLGKGYERASQAKLIQKICSGEFLPSYTSKWFDHVQTFCEAPLTLATNEGRHGQGARVKKVPPILAELTINWVAAAIQFIVRRHLEKIAEDQPPPLIDDDEPVPF